MYIPAAYAEEEEAALLGLIGQHPLATLVTSAATTGLFATHLPLEIDRTAQATTVLVGHMARANPHWKQVVGDGIDALAIFSGPEAYVSPNWYAAKQEHGRVVPTWNYAVVHAHGTLRIRDDRAFLRAHLEMLTTHHEAGQPAPWHVSDAPEEFIEQQMKAIVAIELTVHRLEGKWKMSQNRSAADIAGVVHGLEASGQPASRVVAEVVAARCPASKRS